MKAINDNLGNKINLIFMQISNLCKGNTSFEKCLTSNLDKYKECASAVLRTNLKFKMRNALLQINS